MPKAFTCQLKKVYNHEQAFSANILFTTKKLLFECYLLFRIEKQIVISYLIKVGLVMSWQFNFGLILFFLFVFDCYLLIMAYECHFVNQDKKYVGGKR